MSQSNRTNEEMAGLARKMAVAAKTANYRSTKRAYAHTKRGEIPAILVKFCVLNGISLAGIERAYRVAFDEA